MQASTLGSLEALLEFLKSPAVKIPVSGINIGPVHKKDIMRASVMLEKGRKKFACLLAFDVPVTREAREMAESLGVKVFTADIIYHLFDQFTAYLKTVGTAQHFLTLHTDFVFVQSVDFCAGKEHCLYYHTSPSSSSCTRQLTLLQEACSRCAYFMC